MTTLGHIDEDMSSILIERNNYRKMMCLLNYFFDKPIILHAIYHIILELMFIITFV